MRQRNIKNLQERIDANSFYLIRDPRKYKGRWKEVFGNRNPIYLEIGSGKGKFIMDRVRANKDINYIACEGQDNVGLRVLEKSREAGLPNIRVFMEFIHDISEYFEEGELSGIYLNFSDPWPKERHAKRRLTHRRNLMSFMKVIRPGGTIEFKTDNDSLYEFSLDEIRDLGYEILESTTDLHGGDLDTESRHYRTEYEERFLAKGKNINYVKFRQNTDDTNKGRQQMIFARENGRTIPKEDKIFGISNRAQAMIAKEGKDKVINGTIGALMDDEGKLIVLDSVNKVFQSLTPDEYAPYAPIGGTPEFKEAIKKAAFGNYEPKGFTEAVATPGGTGGIRNTVSNYSAPGDRVLVADWFWAPYKTICQEIGREIQTFKFFNDERGFNIDDFKKNVLELLEDQESLVIIINSPAHNPTGYSLSVTDWKNIKAIFEKTPQDKHVALFCDVAYIDFAGDEEQYRQFLPVLDEMPENVLPVIGYSASKTFTLYGMRCGAMICMAKTPAIAQEFKQVCEFSSRGSWSNCNRSAQTVIAKIYADPELKSLVDKERAEYREMLIRRGKAFEAAANECGLEMVPFDAGFFASVPMTDPDAVAAELEKEGVFLVPLAKGIRASVASMSEEQCKKVPERIKAVMEKLGVTR